MAIDADNPYLKIDEAFTADSMAASAKHEQAAAPLNQQLQKDLDEASDQGQRDEILAKFAEAIEPIQEAHTVALQKAQAKCDKAKAKVQAAYDQFQADREAEMKADKEAKDAERLKWNEQLKGRLESGEATPAEIQKILASLLEVNE